MTEPQGAQAGARERREPLLREFLARHDLRCERCGYNLRNITEPLCPECGYVIPRPGTDDLNKDLEGTRPEHRLWCIHCGHDVRGVEGRECPGCGKSLLLTRERAMVRATARFLPGVSGLYLLLCGVSVVLVGWWLVLTVTRPGLVNGRMVGALASAAAPLALLWVRVSRRGEIEERGWSRGLGAASITAAVVCVGLAVWLMR